MVLSSNISTNSYNLFLISLQRQSSLLKTKYSKALTICDHDQFRGIWIKLIQFELYVDSVVKLLLKNDNLESTTPKFQTLFHRNKISTFLTLNLGRGVKSL